MESNVFLYFEKGKKEFRDQIDVHIFISPVNFYI